MLKMPIILNYPILPHQGPIL